METVLQVHAGSYLLLCGLLTVFFSPFCTHLSILFLSVPFPIIGVREGKETLQK